jgi:hypothetical protein
VRRTQLYLDEDLWNALHERAAAEKTTISELVRKVLRERYPVIDYEKRKQAMMAFVGLWKDRTDLPSTEKYLRQLRGNGRMKRLMKQMERSRKP